MQVVDGPLVEYYRSCVEDLKRSGFHILMLALVRDADAPTFYDDLLRYWNSLNDVTGQHVVFAVAGGSAAERVGVGVIHGQGYYSEHMALAERSTFEIGQLRRMAGPRRNVEPLLGNVADANTAQVSALCNHLQVAESDLPCLHLTYLETGKCLVLPLTGALGTTIYSTCKDIISQLQPSIRLFERAAVIENSPLRPVQERVRALTSQITKAQREIGEVNRRRSKPYEAVERDSLAAYFRARLSERPDFTPAGMGPLVELCENHGRAAGDVEAARRLLGELKLIPRLDKKARRMLEVAFSATAIEFDCISDRKAELDARLVALTHEVASLEDERASLRREESRLEVAERVAISEQQRPARRAIADAFESLRPIVPAELAERNWDFFLSYAAADRDIALKIFKQLEGVGPTFMDVFCLLPGQDWQRFLPDIQARCRFTVPLLSKNSRSAHFQNSEIQRAINLMRQGKHQVFPIYTEAGIEAPFGLEQVHGVHYSHGVGGSAVGALRRSLAQLGYAAAPAVA